jgi:transcription-repair coupling factor (superfamily II helicase)
MTDVAQAETDTSLNLPTISNVVGGSECFALAKLSAKHKKTILHIAIDDVHMERTIEGLRYFSPEIEVLPLPAWDCIPYDRVSPNTLVVSERIETLTSLITPANKPRIVITTVNAAMGRLIPKDVLANSVFNAAVGDTINHDKFSHFLVQNGYFHTATVNEPGEFCIRGNIIDICPSGADVGYRLDFFSDELENIRTFDLLSQISTGDKKDSIKLAPASEIVLHDGTINHFREEYRQLFGSVSTKAGDPLYEAISEGRKYAGQEHWLPLFYKELNTIFDYVGDAIITLDSLANHAAEERTKLIIDSFETRERALSTRSMNEVAYKPIPAELLYLQQAEWVDILTARKSFYLHPYALPDGNDTQDAGYRIVPNFHVESNKQQMTAFDMMKGFIKPEIIKGKGKKKIKPLIACTSEGSLARMENLLKEYSIPFVNANDWVKSNNGIRSGAVGLALLKIENGFEAENIAVISEQDLLGEKIFRKRAGKKRRAEKFLAEAANLSTGELITHKQHGIGKFMGLETMTIAEQTHDFVLLVYYGDDKLYVPVENIDLITRYGGDASHTQLDKLGGVSWQKRTANAKKRIKVAAEELIAVAAKRGLRKAKIFSATGGAYDEFSARFPYTETEDQLSAIEDVIEDLAAGKPMDRLICGDVGFGKTEVALRAAFIVAHPAEIAEDPTAKGQVAIIAPTTLLCRQHFNDFIKRFDGLGITIRQMSRMNNAKHIAETKRMLAQGEVDIVIGTHALLAKDIEFKSLALLVVDEEQRFGVAQKERLKKIRGSTHVLTMTATPIPRTLQLSMSGIRDLSLITTAPIDRLAVRTFVMPYDPVVIRDSILREHYRGGRTFYVCPRVNDVEELLPKLKELIPEVKIVAAHGRMNPEELDKIMQAFYEGTYDVLLATTIVESGLDVPMANNLVIHRADMFGLGQLYQIRGRVGRSKTRAYAYLTIPPKKIPTPDAMKRLEVMQKLDKLGAGFTLASHDMDIRGFGNLLGDEQSGNVKEVGVELYQSMLREAMAALKSEEDQTPNDAHEYSPKINLGNSVLIPEDYVPNLELRMSLYRRIGNIEDEEEIAAMEIEMVDRFGPMPDEVENLIHVVRIKRLCRKANVERVDAGPKGAVLTFYKNHFPEPESLIAHITRNARDIKIRGDHKFVIYDQRWDDIHTRMGELRTHLTNLTKLMEKKNG